ncbi:MAG: lipopolysaccharide transport periplasmic protein LptA [Gammaproteobacteria bacterium]|nr:lipopolysaccharide transport periplasmic protein LptA [Gammaproteobacteria bacterium]
MRNNRLQKIVLLLSVGLGCGTVSALPGDADQPMHVEAGSFEANKRTGISVFRGEVLITKGSITIKAEEARLRVEQDEIVEATIIGNPAEFSQQPDMESERVQGWAERIEYDAKKNLIDLVGNAKVIQGADLFEGETIHYNTAEERVIAKSSDRPQERVVVTFMPRQARDEPQEQAPPENQQQEQND